MMSRTLILLATLYGSHAFSIGEMDAQRPSSMDSRRSFFSRVATTTASTLIAGAGVLEPANAVGGVSKVSAKLKGYGLPALGKVPDGFSPLLDIYGKGRNRFPILVLFSHPNTWVTTLPSNDVNGEDGTIQAGDYGKGDTATFYVYSEPGHVDDIGSQPKDLFETALRKSISQKGDNMYQNFKLIKYEPVKKDGQTYIIADFKYQLLTGAGFEVDRRGVASITSEGPAVEVLWAASTTARFKKTEQALRDITDSFRCYTEGINMSDELVQYD